MIFSAVSHTDLLVQVLLALVGGGGALGAVAALYKLRPDVNSAAVVQAQGTMEMMATLNTELKDALSRSQVDVEQLQAKCAEQEKLINTLREMLHGAAMWDDVRRIEVPRRKKKELGHPEAD